MASYNKIENFIISNLTNHQKDIVKAAIHNFGLSRPAILRHMNSLINSGRVLANGFPTGVEVCESMVHGGPFPASTNFGATSVGTMSIRRFLRPVCYQNMPTEMLPTDIISL